MKYTFDGGKITVIIGKDEKNATIRVEDTGIGLKEEKTDRLFERFYQGNNSSGLHIEGTGIGLNLCKAFVEMHGGKIKAYNRTDGIKGSCFEVSIPLGKSHLQPGEILEEEDNWSDQKGEFLGGKGAEPVYALYGLDGIACEEMPPVDTPYMNGSIAYHNRKGPHAVLPYDWEQFLRFADKYFKNK